MKTYRNAFFVVLIIHFTTDIGLDQECVKCFRKPDFQREILFHITELLKGPFNYKGNEHVKGLNRLLFLSVHSIRLPRMPPSNMI